MIKKGYAVVIQNTEYCEKAYASPVNSFVVVQFFKKCGFETDIVTNNSAQVMFCRYSLAVTAKHNTKLCLFNNRTLMCLN